ncbi:MAG: SMP-30/gluconolactonase/LRE family protein [Bacteroidia bacterium]
MKNLLLLLLAALVLSPACRQQPAQPAAPAAADTLAAVTTPGVARLSPALDTIIPPGATIEVLAGGYTWSEGPLWIGDPDSGFIIYSDVPENRVYQWREGQGASVYLSPSGYTGTGAGGREPGSNGLLLDAAGRLVLCQHGDRRIARMDAAPDAPASTFTTLADNYQGRRFSSPNDAVYDPAGRLYFTDPPYGLAGGDEDPGKELAYNGVYRLDPDGSVVLLIDSLTRPNGIALSPDARTLYVAISDGQAPRILAYSLDATGQVGEGRLFFDAKPHGAPDRKGAPDGLKVAPNGIVFATGPGGVWVLSPTGEPLGLIQTGRATANCALGDGGRYLYMTAHQYLMRIAVFPS